MKKVIFTYDSKDMKHGQNGEIGEASASILVEDERAKKSMPHSMRIVRTIPPTSSVSEQSVSAGAANICVAVATSRAASRPWKSRRSKT